MAPAPVATIGIPLTPAKPLPPPSGMRMGLLRLEVSEFFPAGCHTIIPGTYREPRLVQTPRAAFPSVEECASLDSRRTLYHLAAAGSAAMDYVVFLRDERRPEGRPIFQIRKALEVLWSPDGSRAAITVFTGSNWSDVLLLRMDDPKPSAPIPTLEALEGVFSSYLAQAPTSVVALGWTASGELVLRARGQEALPPYSRFGYELLVDTDHLERRGAIRFLRGYTARAAADAAAAAPVATQTKTR
ncbi:hypothetical protein DB354_05965 [Opitutus sp. ER46]|nr:hypothetical protein DB354_05965 [Opitutus sp. ER46]